MDINVEFLLALASTLFAGFAILQAGRALRVAEGNDRVNQQLNKRLLEIEEERDKAYRLELQQAQLVPNPLTYKGSYYLKVENQGKATATDIQILVNGKLAEGPSQIFPGGCQKYNLGFKSKDSEDSKRISIKWVDATGGVQNLPSIMMHW